MKLKHKTLILLALIIVVSLSAIFVYQIIGLKQKQLFEAETSKTQEFIINHALETTTNKLIEFTKDNSGWDDMVSFISKPDLTWIKNNYEVSVSTYHISVSLLYDKNKNLIYTAHGTSIPKQQFIIDKGLLDAAFNKSPFCHFFHFSGTDLYEISGAAVVPSIDFFDRETKPQGYLLNAKHCDSTYLKNLKTATGFNVQLSKFSEKEGIVKPINSNNYGYRYELFDFQNKPIASLDFSKENYLNLEIERFTYFGIIAGIIALMVFVFSFLIFNSLVISPVTKISRALAEHSKIPIEPLLKGTGEFKELAYLMSDFFEQKNLLTNNNTILSTAIEQSPATILITDRDGNIDYVNPAFVKITGYTFEETKGKNPRFLKSGKTDQEIYKNLWETITSGKTWRGELVNKKKNGEFYYEEAIITPVIGVNDLVTHYIAIKTDISHRKKQDERIANNNRRLQLLLSLSLLKDADMDQILDKALDFSVELTNSKIGFIYYYNEENKQFTLHSWSKDVMEECKIREKKTVYQLDKTGIWGEVVRQRKPIIINDFESENPDKKGYPDGHVHLNRFLSIPVFSGNEIVAIIGVGNKQDPYDKIDILQLNLLAESIWAISRQKEHEKWLAKYAKDLKQSNDEYLSQTEELNQLLEMVSASNDMLAESEEKFRQLFQFVPIPFGLVSNTSGDILLLNDKFIELLGYTNEDIPNLDSWWKLAYPDERYRKQSKELWESEVEKAISSKTDISPNEYNVNSKDGRTLIMEIGGTTIQENFVATFIDLTQRKTLENEIVESKEKLRALINSIPDLIWLKDADGLYLQVNSRFEDFFGAKEAQIIGKTDYDFLDKELADFFRENDKKAMLAMKPTKNEELITFASDGHQEYLETIKTPIYGVDQKLIGILGVGRDMTKRKQAELALKENEEKLQELNVTKDKLFSIIGHDLRGPISSIKSMFEMLISDFDLSDTEQLTKILKIVDSTAGKSYDLLENLLHWAKSQRNEIVFAPENINLYEISEASTALMKESANKKGITIHNSIPDDYMIFADVNMLRTILRNLISNAIKFTKENKNIYLSILKEETKCIVSVKDEGIGIAAEDLGKIFNSTETYTTYGTAGEKGSGLGLLLCNDFIKKHGGKIWVESKLNEGSNFKFSLPMAG